jgi:hypothetical protein
MARAVGHIFAFLIAGAPLLRLWSVQASCLAEILHPKSRGFITKTKQKTEITLPISGRTF